jgi:hypothetical protein
MPRGRSRDLRKRLDHAVTSGQTPDEVARASDLSARLLAGLQSHRAGLRRAQDHLRADRAWAFTSLRAAIGDGLAAITTRDITGFYRHAGFALPQPTVQSS